MFEPISDRKSKKWKFWLVSVSLGFALVAGLASILQMTYMPLRSYKGPIPPLSNEQAELKNRLEEHVKFLSRTIGERNLSRRGSLSAAIDSRGVGSPPWNNNLPKSVDVKDLPREE